jgi:hypothetical protein
VLKIVDYKVRSLMTFSGPKFNTLKSNNLSLQTNKKQTQRKEFKEKSFVINVSIIINFKEIEWDWHVPQETHTSATRGISDTFPRSTTVAPSIARWGLATRLTPQRDRSFPRTRLSCCCPPTSFFFPFGQSTSQKLTFSARCFFLLFPFF